LLENTVVATIREQPQAPEIMMSLYGGASGSICIGCGNDPMIFFD
jgi:hypothetical protein